MQNKRLPDIPRRIFRSVRQICNACLPVLLSLLFNPASPAADAPLLLVTGYGSDNVVVFDSNSGSWSQLLRLPPESNPRGIAATPKGELLIGLHSRSRNILRFTAADGFQRPVQLTRRIGRFGPGILLPQSDGSIYTSGDTERVLLHVYPSSATNSVPNLTTAITATNCCNMVGLLRVGDRLLTGEYFQQSVLEFDLRRPGGVGKKLINRSPHLQRPMGLARGHNGNLFVSNGLSPTVVEFDLETGEYIRTFINLETAAPDGIYGMLYVSEMNRYVLTTGSHVHEFDTEGKLVASYYSPALVHGYGIAAVPASARDLFLVRHEQNVMAKSRRKVSRTISMLKSSGGQMQISGTVGERYIVSATSDFVTWEEIGIVENTTGLVRFADPMATELDQRFYRFALITSGAPKK